MFVGMLIFLILFLNFDQLPAAKKGFKNGAAQQTFDPSYFDRALVDSLYFSNHTIEFGNLIF